MSQLLASWIKMREALLLSPNHFNPPRLNPGERDRFERENVLLRSLTAAEGVELLPHRELPQRLPFLAEEVGLSADHCARVLGGVAYLLTEGLRPLPPEPHSGPGERTVSTDHSGE